LKDILNISIIVNALGYLRLRPAERDFGGQVHLRRTGVGPAIILYEGIWVERPRLLSLFERQKSIDLSLVKR
jgi:hypothetical protein